MTNKERNLIKAKIIKCLTEDFKNNQAIFDPTGYQIYNNTDLEMAKYEILENKKPTT